MKQTVTQQLHALDQRARWTCNAMWAFIAMSVVTVPLAALLRLADPHAPSGEIVTQLQPVFFLLNQIVFIAAAIMLCLWTYRAHANLRAMGVDRLSHSPGWAVWSYFIPIVGLIAPFGIMRELYNRSAGEPSELADQGVDDITSWWACYVSGNLIQFTLGTVRMVGPLTGIHIVTPPLADAVMAVLAIALLAASAYFLIRIVTAITAAQHGVTSVGETFA